MAVKTFTVEAKGVGRRDYTEGIEFSVEPLIMSYQQEFHEWRMATVPAGGDAIVDIPITSGTVVMLYDFFASIPRNTLIGLVVQAVVGILIGDAVNKQGYGSIHANLSKGIPFFETIRFTVHNYDVTDIDVNVGASGIETDVSHYFMTLMPP